LQGFAFAEDAGVVQQSVENAEFIFKRLLQSLVVLRGSGKQIDNKDGRLRMSCALYAVVDGLELFLRPLSRSPGGE
jgi:hypothetical protein